MLPIERGRVRGGGGGGGGNKEKEKKKHNEKPTKRGKSQIGKCAFDDLLNGRRVLTGFILLLLFICIYINGDEVGGVF